MTARHIANSDILGEGSFGVVTKKDNNAVKTFKSLPLLVNEIVVTRYVSRESPYFIKVKRYNPNNLTMTMELWDTSLAIALKKGLTKQQKQTLHICILKGKAFLESRYIVHSDLKLQNILVNADRTKAVIADFGASSMSNTAKIQCTPYIATPSVSSSHRSHDGFGLATVTLQLMYNYNPGRTYSCAELRNKIKRVVKDPREASILCGLVKDDYTLSSRTEDLLYDLYGIRVDYRLVEVDLVTSQDIDLRDMVRKHVGALYKLHKFNKEDRCRMCCTRVLSMMDADIRKRKIYIATMAFIFGCTFEYTVDKDFSKEDRMTHHDVLKYAKCTEKELFRAMSTILSYKDIIRFMFVP